MSYLSNILKCLNMKTLFAFCVILFCTHLSAKDTESVFFQKEYESCNNILVTSFPQKDKFEGIYCLKKIKKRKGFSCYSFNEDNTILHISISIGSFDNIWEEKYIISGDTITTEDGWVIIPSKYKKANKKMINRIETRIGKVLNGYGYCVHKNFILRCADITH